MDSAAGRGQRFIWVFWLAAAIVFIGGLLPLVFGGSSSRVDGVALPFTIGAIGLAACALLNNQGRATVAVIYFFAGLAIVFGILSMLSLPIRLVALGSCPIAPNPCTTGLPRALSDGENTGIGAATAFGIVAVFVGFFGLVTLYRRTVTPAFTPPVRKIPPMAPAEASPPDSPDSPGSSSAKSTESPDYPMLAEDDEPELPAPEELPELPAHESNTAST